MKTWMKLSVCLGYGGDEENHSKEQETVTYWLAKLRKQDHWFKGDIWQMGKSGKKNSMKGSNTQECRQMKIHESCEYSFVLFAINSKFHLRTQIEEAILLNLFGNIMLGGVLLPCSWTPAPD